MTIEMFNKKLESNVYYTLHYASDTTGVTMRPHHEIGLYTPMWGNTLCSILLRMWEGPHVVGVRGVATAAAVRDPNYPPNHQSASASYQRDDVVVLLSNERHRQTPHNYAFGSGG